jgi:hypothetical protein
MIKTTDFISDDAKKEAEQIALGTLLDTFAKEMGQKIFLQMQKGYQGWDKSEMIETLKQKLLTNFEKGDMVDVSILAMFLWNLQQK